MSLSRLNLTRKFIVNLNQSKNVRLISSTMESREKLATKMEAKNEWNRAVSEAEKIVGYQTSFLSLRYLLSDEITNLALHLRKLIGSPHPLVNTAKTLIYGQNMQTWGLIVLLVSKMAGHAADIPEMEQDKSAGVLISQRTLAEVVEMVRTANLVHQGVFNLQHLHNAGNNLSPDSDMIFGNKIALLGGDYLLGSACAQIGRLKHQELNELMCTAFRDIADSHFIGERDLQNHPLPTDPRKKMIEEQSRNQADVDEISVDQIDNKKPFNLKDVMGSPENEWTLRHTLAEGTLLGKSCQSALLLAKQPEELQRHAYFFGKHLSLAWQASMDLEPFRLKELPYDSKISLISAPVLFHLEHDASIYDEIKKGIESVNDIDFNKLHKAIVSGPGIEKTRELQSKHTLFAMQELYKFPLSDARIALENIILAMQDN